jgi:quercetin dioxygenase-like cupin family protein
MGTVISQDELPFSVIAREFEGHLQGGVGLSMFFVDAPPGRGPGLHKHAYDELFIVQEGSGRFRLGDDEREVGAGEIAIAPAGTPHGFKSGDDGLRMIAVSNAERFATEWLE